jgi:membrane protease subunit (stomatin/prohibitin family)|nr:SPFH domain-containing protein [Butyrivibrio sp.]
MALFNNNNAKEKSGGGILGAFSTDVIKWEPASEQEASIVVHKHQYEDFPNGSYLIVAPSQMAFFVNNMNAGSSTDASLDGTAQVAVFEGPCKIKLDTGDSRFAPFRNMTHALTGGESAFHSTVYFINTTYMNELGWGTQQPVNVVDPEEEVNIHVRAQGMFGVHLEHEDTTVSAINANKFIRKVVGTQADYTRDELIRFMRAKILEYVPDLLANAIIRENIGILKISAYLRDFSEKIYKELVPHFDEFGLTLDNFSFHSINAPDEDLRLVNEMKIKRKQKQLEAQGNAAQMDIESEAIARKRQREGYTYQQEQAFGVMGAAASNEGTAGSVMGAGMGLGMGFGVGNVMNQGMNNIAQGSMGVVNMQAPSKAASEDTIDCPKCGSANPSKAKFCLNCGEKMEKAPAGVCPSCGEPIVPGAKFCLNCGQKLGANTCPNCGKEIVPGSKFCLECGTPLT